MTSPQEWRALLRERFLAGPDRSGPDIPSPSLRLDNAGRARKAGEAKAAELRAALGVVDLDRLPAGWLEAVRLRLAYPDLSSRELGALCRPPVRPSTVRYRIMAFLRSADEQRKDRAS